jgi:hypothetical protein
MLVVDIAPEELSYVQWRQLDKISDSTVSQEFLLLCDEDSLETQER